TSPGFGTKPLAVGVGAGIILDATVVRALLVPALMRLLGDANVWLPGWGLALAGFQLRDLRAVGCSDRLAGLGIEEVEPSDVDGERDTVSGRDRHAWVDPRDALGGRRTRESPRGRLP